jgi:hypothetical protein
MVPIPEQKDRNYHNGFFIDCEKLMQRCIDAIEMELDDVKEYLPYYL